ncbi:MAG: PadR family transcriptional regulator [Gemmatimonadetes bacterium]|nr:PadR family transcriptional regulator [Gemmatimonadota bacterium]NIR79970.1 PadR family transcriptional regulator [Gemmatimonadota bacterium]NIT90307.1 PadR family transcriptional regulator [Gemmatimonadota bacterium]NIU32506.1 PadR family transcriptional regulator [Gemmatimonadota bacterium]NIU36985.1 PadR family transcriptional regulator [Gemmatimonadota bacterium]
MTKRLGEFEQILLFAVLRLQGGAYGAAIREEIEERTGRGVSPGAIYTVLGRLESQGLVSSELGDTTPARGGRRRKLFRLEPAGAVALQEAYGALQGIAQGTLADLSALASEGGAGADR